MTLEELIDKTFVGKRITVGTSGCYVIEKAQLATELDDYDLGVRLDVETGGYVELGLNEEFTLTDVEVGE